MKAAVLIVTWKGWRDTVECLASLTSVDMEGCTIVVCDNASPDDSLSRVRAWATGSDPEAGAGAPGDARASGGRVPFVELSRGEAEEWDGALPDVPLVLVQTGANLGFAGGNNVGLRLILSDPEVRYVWLLNPDTTVAPDSFRRLVQYADGEPEVGMVGSKVLFYDDPDVIQAAGGGRVIAWQGMTRFLGRGARDDGGWDSPRDLEYVTGCSMLVRAEMVRSVGLLDERYFLYSEEVDWCLRARAAGWRLAYCPGSRVWHKEGRAVGGQSLLADFYSVRNFLLLTRKFHPALVPVAFAHSVFRCLLPKLVRLQFGRLRAVLRAYGAFFREAPDTTRAPGFKPLRKHGLI